MYLALKKLGHDIYFFAHLPRLNKIYKGLQFVHDGVFDLILCSSNTALNDIREIKGKKVFISHGIIPALEQPIAGADIYIAVSEEVAENCKARGFAVTQIIRNPIGCERFPYVGCSESLKSIVFIDRRTGFRFINQLKNHDFNIMDTGRPPVIDTRLYIRDADLVISRGRNAYEAMAMGKNVITTSVGSELMDGLITENSFLEFRKCNCSGRYKNIPITSVSVLLDEAQKYNQAQGLINRELILEHNDSMKIAGQFLELVN